MKNCSILVFFLSLFIFSNFVTAFDDANFDYFDFNKSFSDLTTGSTGIEERRYASVYCNDRFFVLATNTSLGFPSQYSALVLYVYNNDIITNNSSYDPVFSTEIMRDNTGALNYTYPVDLECYKDEHVDMIWVYKQWSSVASRFNYLEYRTLINASTPFNIFLNDTTDFFSTTTKILDYELITDRIDRNETWYPFVYITRSIYNIPPDDTCLDIQYGYCNKTNHECFGTGAEETCHIVNSTNEIYDASITSVSIADNLVYSYITTTVFDTAGSTQFWNITSFRFDTFYLADRNYCCDINTTTSQVTKNDTRKYCTGNEQCFQSDIYYYNKTGDLYSMFTRFISTTDAVDSFLHRINPSTMSTAEEDILLNSTESHRFYNPELKTIATNWTYLTYADIISSTNTQTEFLMYYNTTTTVDTGVVDVPCSTIDICWNESHKVNRSTNEGLFEPNCNEDSALPKYFSEVCIPPDYPVDVSDLTTVSDESISANIIFLEFMLKPYHAILAGIFVMSFIVLIGKTLGGRLSSM